jgi:hypothetical protein
LSMSLEAKPLRCNNIIRTYPFMTSSSVCRRLGRCASK